MQINKDADRVEVTIKGLKITVPAPFAEGHSCSANEANVLNQILRENVRNNNARSAEKVIEAAGGAVDKVNIADFQGSIDTYIDNYEFGVRRAGTGGGRTLDPVAKETQRLAVEIVKAAMAAKGLSIKDIGGMTRVNEVAKEYAEGENGESLTARAKENVEARSATAAAGIGIKLKKQKAAE